MHIDAALDVLRGGLHRGDPAGGELLELVEEHQIARLSRRDGQRAPSARFRDGNGTNAKTLGDRQADQAQGFLGNLYLVRPHRGSTISHR